MALSTWMTPQPALNSGLLVAYGDDRLMADQIAYRGYSAACAIAAMSPVMLGRAAYVRTSGGWVGPCVVADVVAQHHAYRAVFLLGEVAEVPDSIRRRLGFTNGAMGEVCFCRCPPGPGLIEAVPYSPAIVWAREWERRPVFYFEEQAEPGRCPVGWG